MLFSHKAQNFSTEIEQRWLLNHIYGWSRNKLGPWRNCLWINFSINIIIPSNVTVPSQMTLKVQLIVFLDMLLCHRCDHFSLFIWFFICSSFFTLSLFFYLFSMIVLIIYSFIRYLINANDDDFRLGKTNGKLTHFPSDEEMS